MAINRLHRIKYPPLNKSLFALLCSAKFRFSCLEDDSIGFGRGRKPNIQTLTDFWPQDGGYLKRWLSMDRTFIKWSIIYRSSFPFACEEIFIFLESVKNYGIRSRNKNIFRNETLLTNQQLSKVQEIFITWFAIREINPRFSPRLTFPASIQFLIHVMCVYSTWPMWHGWILAVANFSEHRGLWSFFVNN